MSPTVLFWSEKTNKYKYSPKVPNMDATTQDILELTNMSGIKQLREVIRAMGSEIEEMRAQLQTREETSNAASASSMESQPEVQPQSTDKKK